MKKSTILTFATAAAVLATSAGTFAAWDQTSVSQTQNVTLAKPVTMTLSQATLTTNKTVGADVPVYEGTGTLKITNLPKTATTSTHEITYTAKVYTDAQKTTEAKGVTATAKEETPAATLDDDHTVTVTVTPEDNAEAKELANNATELTVEVTANLTAK